MKQLRSILAIVLILFTSCTKETINEAGPASNPTGTSGKIDLVVFTPYDTTYSPSSKVVLVDASKDGGVWWYPQGSGTFSASAYHQGKALADYLRTQGYKVHEVPRNVIITSELLNKYTYVIRAGGFGHYTAGEIDAYESFLAKPSSLLLLQDHLSNFPNDLLSVQLGAKFEGSMGGTITSFSPHEVTNGVNSFPFMTGSVIRNYDPAKVSILGSLSFTSGGEIITAGVMGILHHPTSRIFFIGDINGIETIPQPFTANLFRWLLR